ncbi:MAG TPA: glycosyltransferase family 4 protein [Pirellulales bacterium]|jgi:glycosyltransferase involved in cell wall biosynthesis|nr:glycosyltransferase family 4 protein [Pirellulales bacterium]
MSFAIDQFAPAARSSVDRPLRVLLVTQVSGGGVARHFVDLARGLSARGVDVTGIYAPHKLDANFRARLADGDMPPMHGLAMRRALHPLDSADLWRLMRLIHRLGPFDLVHGHSSKGGALARMAARALGLPSVYTPNAIVTLDPTLSAWKRQLYGRIECWLARHTAAVIAVSDDEARHIHDLGIDPRIVQVIANGIDQPPFPPREEVRSRLGIKPDELVIGFVGRLSSQKAPELLLEAFARAFTERSDVRLVMVGSGPLHAEMQRRVAALGLASRVMLLGDVVACDFMPAFDVFCLSSRYEGMPYVYLEALAAGLPIVSTRVGGATMCVQPGCNGLLVAPDDGAALAAALQKLVDDRPLRERFAAASRQLARRFTADQMLDQTMETYNSVLAGQLSH